MNVQTGLMLRVVSGCFVLGACIPGNKAEDVFSEPPTRAPTPLAPALVQVRMSEKVPVAVSGGTLRILSDQRTAVAADPDRDKIFVVDITSRKATPRTIDLQAGDEPGRVVEDANGRVHVVLRRGGAIVTLSPETFVVAARRPVCAAPRGLAYDGRTDRLHVACAGGEFVSLASDPTIADPLQATRLDVDLRDVVVIKDRIFVSRFRSAEVLTLDATLKVIERRSPGSILDQGGRKPQTGTNAKAPTAGSFGETPPSVLWRMQALWSGEILALHQAARAEEVSTAPGGYGSGGGPCGGGLVQTVISRVGGGSTGRGVSLSGSVAVDLAVSPDETRMVAVANGNAQSPFGAQQVMAAPLSMMSGGGGCVGPTGGSGRTPRPPSDAGVSDPAPAPANPEDGDLSPEVFELRGTVGEATSVAFARRGHIVVQTREPATLQVLTSGQDYTIRLSQDSRFDTGHALFHTAPGFSGLACASCHPEGGDDGRVWTFEKLGPRRTQSLRGGILATAPFHWDGELRDLSHLMNEVFESRMQGPKLSPAHVGSLARFMDKLPLVPLGKPQDEAAAERGRTLFASQNCATCHTSGGHTDNKTVNVGTGGGMQTPSLRGVVMRAPFMHNGCAGTLKDRFNPECGGGDKHGLTGRLSPAQILDLVAFMETL